MTDPCPRCRLPRTYLPDLCLGCGWPMPEQHWCAPDHLPVHIAPSMWMPGPPGRCPRCRDLQTEPWVRVHILGDWGLPYCECGHLRGEHDVSYADRSVTCDLCGCRKFSLAKISPQ